MHVNACPVVSRVAPATIYSLKQAQPHATRLNPASNVQVKQLQLSHMAHACLFTDEIALHALAYTDAELLLHVGAVLCIDRGNSQNT